MTRVLAVFQFYPWFNFYFPLFLSVVTYDNEYKTKKKIEARIKLNHKRFILQHISLQPSTA